MQEALKIRLNYAEGVKLRGARDHIRYLEQSELQGGQISTNPQISQPATRQLPLQ